MANISADELAARLLDDCLNARPWSHSDARSLASAALSDDPRQARSAARALFTGLIEPFADLFDPRLAADYAAIFSVVIARALPSLRAPDLLARYGVVSSVRPITGEPKRVIVLSRVTLGADISITSLFLDAAKRRFPAAGIILAGASKAWELFERDPRLTLFAVEYGRSSTLAERLATFEPLRQLCDQPGTILLDPDSRLSQLGLLPLCPAENHFLFPSRAFGGDSLDPLPVLAARWIEQTLGINDAQPYLHPRFNYQFGPSPAVTASFGVGGNHSKRIDDLFEHDIAAHLASLPAQVFIDAGIPGSEEEARVRAAVEAAGEQGKRIGIHTGSFASFAAMIAASSLYFGYDSAGQHVAAAMGVPVVSVFKGFANQRMLARWTPHGPGPVTVLRADRFQDSSSLLDAAVKALTL
ncbi:MAG: hypothetical protein C0504_10835 [Candidatus Solibacter sp.]|nr:hypothetical protein [Candidatus Solibacter sp.]